MTSNEQLLALIERAWADVRSDFVFPVLQTPGTSTQTDSIPSALLKDSVVLNLPFVEQMEKLGVSPDGVIRLLLARTVNQYLRVPRAFSEYLRLYAALRAEVYAEQPAERFLNAYFDIWNEMDLHRCGYATLLEEIYPPVVKSLGASGEDMFFRVLAGVLAAKWNVDLGIELEGVNRTLARRLSELDYADSRNREADIHRFGALLSSIFTFTGVRSSSGLGTPAAPGAASAKQEEAPKPRWPLGSSRKPDLAATLGNIKGGIQRFIGELHNESGSDLLLEAISRLGIDAGIGTTKYTPGRPWWYSHLARKYPPLSIAEKDADRDAPWYPIDYADLSLTDNLADFAPIPSFGKLWPGLAKRFVRTGAEATFDRPTIPNLLIALDSSGSMPNPNQKLSHAVLSGVLAANAYLDRGSEVAVYNFSNPNNDIFIGFTDDDVEICRHLAAYQGGGTTLNEAVIDKLLHDASTRGREVDVLLISDMGISNCEGLGKKLASYEGMHRVSLFFVRDACGNFGALSAALSTTSNLSVFKIADDKDLPNVVLGAVQDSLEDVVRQTSKARA